MGHNVRRKVSDHANILNDYLENDLRMMNEFCVISSNCISGFWYHDIVRREYEMPFIWSIVKLSDMLFLIRNFDTIDFCNITSEFSHGEVVRRDGDTWVKIVVDGNINAYFVHYKEDKSLAENEPVIDGINVVSSDILKYAEDTWKRRSHRIPYNKKRVWVFWDDRVNTNIDLNEFLSIAKERENEIFVLFTPNIIETSQNNLIVLPITDYNNVPKHVKDLYKALKTYKKEKHLYA